MSPGRFHASQLLEHDPVQTAAAVPIFVDAAYYAADDRILDEPEVWGVEALGASGVTIRLVVKTSPAAQFPVSRELRRQLKPLGRQAEVARRAQTIQADLRDATFRLAADDLVTTLTA